MTGSTPIIGAGARTPLGRSLPASEAAVRAGIRHVGEHPFVANRVGRRVKMAMASWLDVRKAGASRFVALAREAMGEAMETVRAMPELPHPARAPRLRVVVGLPEASRVGRPPDLDRSIVTALAAEAGCPDDHVSVVSAGHAAATVALQQAVDLLAREEADLCLVGGVDSYYDVPALGWLRDSGRLQTPGFPWGFTPGEGAAFCLLATEAWRSAHAVRAPIAVVGVASAVEAARIHTDAVCTGRGLSEAFGGALAPTREVGRQVDRTIGDLNGEPYRADELGFTLSRHGDALIDPTDVLAPAAFWGDVGAASGALFAGLAFAVAAQGRGPAETSLISTSSEGGTRAAAVLVANPTTGEER